MYIQIGLFHRYYRGFLMIYAFIYSMKHLLLDIYKGSSYVQGFRVTARGGVRQQYLSACFGQPYEA